MDISQIDNALRTPAAHSPWRRHIGWAAALLTAFLVGSVMPTDRMVNAMADVVPILPQIHIRVTPPAVAAPAGGFVVIGASDDLYYQVFQDGRVEEVETSRGRQLTWRKGGE